jgi:nucleoside-diphosphate-sugar epimerase
VPEPAPHDEANLEERLSRPDDATRDALGSVSGDVLVMGAGGKMGATLARMARRALDDIGVPRTGPDARRVIAVSRFSNADVIREFHECGVETVRVDLTNPAAFRELPMASNVIWMVGQKFGTTGDPVATWAHNVAAAVYGADHCVGARTVCFSSGNVYARTDVTGGGSRESDTLAPDGDYAASCVGRERVFEAGARRLQFPLLLYRLFYACDLRYGVVTDVARRVATGQAVSLQTPAVNVIWQGDANRLALRSLTVAGVPPVALNVTGHAVSVRVVAENIARTLGVAATFEGEEATTSLLANTEQLDALLPHTSLPIEQLCEWAARWVKSGGRLLNKPTKYDVRDGKF